MEKGGIYVLLLILGVVALLAAGYGLLRLGRWLLAAGQRRHLEKLDRGTPWTFFMQVSKGGDCVIGVRRSVLGHPPFEGPIEMFRVAADHDPIDLQVKINEAKDRAALYNDSVGTRSDG